MSRHEAPTTVAEAVADYREAHAAIRKIRNNGGGTRATTHALTRWRRIADRADVWLLDNDARTIVGMLIDEASLADRLAAARRAGMDRPELSARLVTVRRNIRRRLAMADTPAHPVHSVSEARQS